ncbi:unnamed protein product [Aureobasidium uvarum]|uniref:Transcription factor Iwr1 domain-containing protein n=1 Tax=Aureobasidium uvarum TaxID=2773716 RepID=A0A9N8KFX5_9PEZI|nr:unnamed protein product [Aureobasidium uvarum]
MAELPSLVRVKRKRGEEPTADLFLEERTLKKQQVWQFRLQQTHPSQLPSDTPNGGVSGASIPSSAVDHFQQEQQQQHHLLHQQLQQDTLVRREFRLARPTRPLHRRIESVRKRKAQLDLHDIPTFVEATPKRRRVGQEDAPQSVADTPVSTPSTLKRPGASSRLKKPTAGALFQSPANPPPDRLADALHRFALEEEAREEARIKPKVTVIPKKPVQRYRERHPEQFAAQAPSTNKTEEDVDMMSDDDDYVYDTYIRTKDPVVPANLESEDASNIQVGYIVISEEDQPLWEMYFEDDAESDKEFETDDEDENGYYAADYPEDEVASDDEYDRGAYGYRHGGSDDEQWESDPDEWSDGDEAMQNPWKKFPWMRSSQSASGEQDGEEL